MHDLIFALAFVAMIATPAMVAAIGGRKEFDPGPSAPPVTASPVRSRAADASISVPPATPTVRPQIARKRAARETERYIVNDGPTLPMHNVRGMANR